MNDKEISGVFYEVCMDKHELGKAIVQSAKVGQELERLPTERIAELLLTHVWVELEVFKPHSDLISEAMERLKRQDELIKVLVGTCEAIYAEVGAGGDLDWHLCQEGYADMLKAALAKAQP